MGRRSTMFSQVGAVWRRTYSITTAKSGMPMTRRLSGSRFEEVRRMHCALNAVLRKYLQRLATSQAVGVKVLVERKHPAVAEILGGDKKGRIRIVARLVLEPVHVR